MPPGMGKTEGSSAVHGIVLRQAVYLTFQLYFSGIIKPYFKLIIDGNRLENADQIMKTVVSESAYCQMQVDFGGCFDGQCFSHDLFYTMPVILADTFKKRTEKGPEKS
jgi:hypothetical protein